MLEPAAVNPTRTTGELKLYPSIEKGMRTPFDLWRYYGRGRSSFNISDSADAI